MPDSRLLHREAEIAALQAVIDRLLAARPSVLLIDGPRGIGKSALLSAMLPLLPPDVLLMRARCAEIEQGFDLAMVGQLFDTASAPVPAGGAADGDRGLRELLDGLYQTTRTLAAGRPVMLLIDDIHLADEQSRQWFSYIARRLDDLPVAAVATADLDQPTARPIDVGADGITLHLGPLCASCIDEAAADLLGAPLDTELAAACHAVSGGNPQVLREFTARLQRAGISPGAPDLARTLHIGAAAMSDTTVSWLHERDGAAVDLLAALAVLGPEAGLTATALLAGQGGYQADESVATLSRAGLVDAGDPPVIASDLVRSAVLQWVGGARRLDLHRRAGELLTRLGASPARAADHLMLVGPTAEPWVLATLRAAAREVAEAGQPELAVKYLWRAAAGADGDPSDPLRGTDPVATPEDPVRSAERNALDAEIGALEMHLDLPAAIRCAASIATRTPGFTERASALLPLANPVLVTESGSAVRPFLQVAATAVSRGPVVPQEQFRFGALALLAGHPVGVRSWTRSLAERGGGEVLPDGSPARPLLAALAAVTAASGRFRPRSMLLAARAASGGDAGAGVIGAVLAACWGERFDQAEGWATAQISRAEQRRHRTELALALLARSDVRYRQGRLAAARADAARAAQFAQAASALGLSAAAAALVAVAASAQGHSQVAVDALDRVQLPPDANPLIRAMVLRARGIAVLSGQSAGAAGAREALALFLECGHELASRGIANPTCLPWRADVAAVHLQLGEDDAAATIAAEDLALARRWGAPGAVGRALTMFAATQPPARARELLSQAVTLLEPTGMTLDLARAHRQLSSALAGCGDQPAADEAMQRGAELAARCGANFGGDPSPAGGQGSRSRVAPGGSNGAAHRPPRLTMSEVRVSELVLRGLSNQQVADQLCISRRTVDTHLNRIYRKLEIRSRSELGYALKLLG